MLYGVQGSEVRDEDGNCDIEQRDDRCNDSDDYDEVTHRLLSSSFLGLPYRILNINHTKELLRSLLGSKDRVDECSCHLPGRASFGLGPFLKARTATCDSLSLLP